ncbi:PH domain-containing protein [Propioniciclava coleopterorum]|uniref:PH domain-containing protein n=1 Tax=Propioniciclava coleopterorum TaxID=2714937 RepID=A0A6G7Y5M2_9ACTN|nr:PH domain-containing protein [Propioniciclava coleopterorum]QIK72122.1 PH domain-containing protein [Propioniciclava coleopterorum]
MALPRKLLGADESVVLHLRTHPKALILPGIMLFALLLAVLIGWTLMPPTAQPWIGWGISAVAAIMVVPFVLLPYLRWRTSTYTLTNRRVITRHGILNKAGHDLPLSRINNVTYDRSLTDRLLGCGTLRFTTAAEAPVTLPDVPDVERVHVVMTELLFGDADGAARTAALED